MSVKIRLARHGRKKMPYYRMVVADSRYPRDGRFIEILGYYHPVAAREEQQVKVDEEKVLKWLHRGALPTDTCRSILRKQGLMQKFHEAKLAMKKNGSATPAASEAPEEPAPEAVPAAESEAAGGEPAPGEA